MLTSWRSGGAGDVDDNSRFGAMTHVARPSVWFEDFKTNSIRLGT